MFSGKRKTKVVTNKQVSTYEDDEGKLSKTEFQGKLSHNPTSPSARITRFFSPQVPKSLSDNQPTTPQAMPVVIGRTSPRRHASTMSVLQQANSKYLFHTLITFMFYVWSVIVKNKLQPLGIFHL